MVQSRSRKCNYSPTRARLQRALSCSLVAVQMATRAQRSLGWVTCPSTLTKGVALRWEQCGDTAWNVLALHLGDSHGAAANNDPRGCILHLACVSHPTQPHGCALYHYICSMRWRCRWVATDVVDFTVTLRPALAGSRAQERVHQSARQLPAAPAAQVLSQRSQPL